MTHPLSHRARHLQPFRTIQILTEAKALIAAGRDIVRLDVGEPNFPTPRPVVDAAAKALADGQISYTQPSGIQELKSAIAAHYERTYGVMVDERRIVITTGSSAALLMTLSVVADRGQEVLSVQPGYPSHDVFAQLGNARLRRIENAKEPFAWPSSRDLERVWTRETVGMLVGSPANPTGATLSRGELAALVRSTETLGGVFVSDELYHGLNYDSRDVTALEISDKAVVVNGLSKYFSMTGWRLGWLVCPPHYRDAIEMMSQHLYLAPP